MQVSTMTIAQPIFFITEDTILAFKESLRDNEKSEATLEKYISAVRKLMGWLNGREITHELLMEYRDYLRLDHTATTVNGSISAINSYLEFWRP